MVLAEPEGLDPALLWGLYGPLLPVCMPLWQGRLTLQMKATIAVLVVRGATPSSLARFSPAGRFCENIFGEGLETTLPDCFNSIIQRVREPGTLVVRTSGGWGNRPFGAKSGVWNLKKSALSMTCKSLDLSRLRYFQSLATGGPALCLPPFFAPKGRLLLIMFFEMEAAARKVLPLSVAVSRYLLPLFNPLHDHGALASGRSSSLVHFAAPHQALRDIGRLQRAAFSR